MVVLARESVHDDYPYVDIVLQDITGGTGLIGVTLTGLGETTSDGIGNQELFSSGHSITTFLLAQHCDLDTINSLQNHLGDTLCHQSDRSSELSELINGQDTITDHVALSGGE